VHPLVLLVVAFFEVALVGLACYRLTRLVVVDTFPPIARPREWIERRTLGTRLEMLGDLLTCHWCASGWISMALVAGVDWFSSVPVPLPVITWAGVWAVGAGLNQLEPEK
jgi:Protein of unknown function (DUF1360)